ncbi:hypothetical protein GCM10009733_032600 [Nonomuraea maheshkhaliensis]|uniref:STAS domain-containing protein n=1 Tax=Nonomuraea maheshkhaliensis TaxID=419590 RepID=A0ABP4R731_9ACTN
MEAKIEGSIRGDELVIVVWHSAVCPVMDLRGELCTTTAAGSSRETDHVLVGRTAAVAVDLSQPAFCDVEGAGALIGAERRARELGGRLVLAGVQGRCAQLLHRAGLDRIFWLLPDPPVPSGTGPPGTVPRGSAQLVAG